MASWTQANRSHEMGRGILPIDVKLLPDSGYWKAEFDAMLAKVSDLYESGQISNEMAYRIDTSWDAKMTYMQIVGILQSAINNIVANKAAR